MSRKKFPVHPPHPERNCWGCDRYCAADKMACGNGSDRTQHPAELFGPDWAEWGDDGRPPPQAPAAGQEGGLPSTPADPSAAPEKGR